jgi:uncharacterized membrane protein
MNQTDTPAAAETPPPIPQPAGKGVRIALILSLAVNLLFIGLLCGAAIGGHWKGTHKMAMDVGFGPLTAALSREDRKAMAESFMRMAPGFGAERQAADADFFILIKALRADPWDSAAANAALERQSARSLLRLDRGRIVLLDHIATMSATARQDLAARIEAEMGRRDLRRRDRTSP